GPHGPGARHLPGAGALPARAGRHPVGRRAAAAGPGQALLLDPKVLCIDELSLGLAPVVVQELMAIVASLKDTGLTLVIVEQSLSVACQICERAVFMEKGEIRFEGAATELLERDDIARAVFLGGHGDGSN